MQGIYNGKKNLELILTVRGILRDNSARQSAPDAIRFSHVKVADLNLLDLALFAVYDALLSYPLFFGGIVDGDDEIKSAWNI